MSDRQYTQLEWKLLSWWLALRHPHAATLQNARVGSPLNYAGGFPGDPAEGESLRVKLRYADAILVENNRVAIVEAKIEPDPGVFSQLIHYLRKFRLDPRMRSLHPLPLDLIAVVYHNDPSVAVEAPFYGVRWEVFRPGLSEMPPAKEGKPELGGVSVPLPPGFAYRLRSWGAVALAGS